MIPRCARFLCFTLLHLLFLPQWACVTPAQRPERGGQEASGWVQFQVQPESIEKVEIYLDEEYFGELSRWKNGVVPMPQGQRRVEIRAPGYFPQRFDFTIKKDDQLKFTIELEPDLEVDTVADPEDDALFQHHAPKRRRAPEGFFRIKK